MRIQVLYFASLKEALGRSVESVDLPADIRTTGQLRDWLAIDRPALISLRNLRCAVDPEMVDFSAELRDGVEVAFFTPVTGG